MNEIGFLNASFLKSLPSRVALVFSVNSLIAFKPAPETAWYVETSNLLILNLSLRGLSTSINWEVEQLGLAIIPLCFSNLHHLRMQ